MNAFEKQALTLLKKYSELSDEGIEALEEALEEPDGMLVCEYSQMDGEINGEE